MITIGGQLIANPSGVELGKFNITKSSRSASGIMNMEIIAKKRKVDLSWDKIAEPDLKQILDLLDSRTFHELTYPDPQGPGGTGIITAYVGDISTRTWHRVNGVRYWDNVSLPLIER